MYNNNVLNFSTTILNVLQNSLETYWKLLVLMMCVQLYEFKYVKL